MAREASLERPLVDNHNGINDADSDIESGRPTWRKPILTKIPSFQDSMRGYHRYLLVLAFITVSLTSAWVGMYIPSHRSLDTACAEHTTQWSPVLRDVSIKYEPQLFNGSFMREDIYRRPGSNEVDAAWEALGVNYRAGIISREDGLASGLDPGFVHRADKHGGGFLVNVEGMHHLHCLNLVRQALYFNYDRYKKMGMHAFKNEEPILRLHITHCLDTVRQVLMCNVDTSVLGQVWVDPDEPMAFPVFNTKHVCKNFDQVREWAEKLQAPPSDETPLDYLAPPGPGEVMESIP